MDDLAFEGVLSFFSFFARFSLFASFFAFFSASFASFAAFFSFFSRSFSSFFVSVLLSDPVSAGREIPIDEDSTSFKSCAKFGRIADVFTSTILDARRYTDRLFAVVCGEDGAFGSIPFLTKLPFFFVSDPFLLPDRLEAELDGEIVKFEDSSDELASPIASDGRLGAKTPCNDDSEPVRDVRSLFAFPKFKKLKTPCKMGNKSSLVSP